MCSRDVVFARRARSRDARSFVRATGGSRDDDGRSRHARALPVVAAPPRTNKKKRKEKKKKRERERETTNKKKHLVEAGDLAQPLDDGRDDGVERAEHVRAEVLHALPAARDEALVVVVPREDGVCLSRKGSGRSPTAESNRRRETAAPPVWL